MGFLFNDRSGNSVANSKNAIDKAAEGYQADASLARTGCAHGSKNMHPTPDGSGGQQCGKCGMKQS